VSCCAHAARAHVWVPRMAAAPSAPVCGRVERALSMGLQTKVILSFLGLLSLALGASCVMFFSHSRERLTDITGEQARQLSSALALGVTDELHDGDLEALRMTAQDLVKGRNVLFVAFLDAAAHPVAYASRDPDFYLPRSGFMDTDVRELMKAKSRRSAVFGNFVEIVAPVLAQDATSREPKLRGYVAVAVSQAGEEAELQRTTYLVISVGCLILACAVPLAYMTTRRIFAPILELVRITRKITEGNLDARVATNRKDAIGELARSFNEMVIRVKKQQQDVAAANRQLAEANRDLESKVAARTSELEGAMEQLNHEMKEKEDFLRAVSHDLNAPLRNISGMATMLLTKYRDKLDEDILHRLERIKTNVDVETDLITELLELSRIKTRRQKFEYVDVEVLFNELRGLFENDLRSKGIQLVADSPLPILDAERARVRQVFQNLIDNAIKYIGEGAVREIHVGCTIRPNAAEFHVRDTGMGIDPDDIDKVFFIFRRGKNSATQNIAGKGVGLASVKSIIEMYGGKIWVESRLGEGTTFRFTIDGKYVPATGKHLRRPRDEAATAGPAATTPPATPPVAPASIVA
jgi:signal transduction histidine kinase